MSAISVLQEWLPVVSGSGYVVLLLCSIYLKWLEIRENHRDK